MINILIGVLHFLIFLFGGTVRLDQVKYPGIFIVTAKLRIIVIVILTIIRWK